MYKVYHNISEVKSFVIGENLLLLSVDNFLYKYKNKVCELVYDFKQGMQDIYYDYFYYVNSNRGEGFYFIEDVDFLKDQYILTFLNEKYVLTVKDGKTNKININTRNIEIEIPNRSLIFHIYNEMLFRRIKKHYIDTYSLSTGLQSWELNISKIGSGKDFEGNIVKGEISQFIGVYNNIVWVLLNSGKIIGINIFSGEIHYLLADVKKQNIHNIELRHNYEGCYVPSARNYFHLDIKKGKIIAESVYALWEVDLNKTNPHFEVWGLEDQLQKYQLKEFGYKTFYIENQLFFYDMNSPKWGVIDWDKKEIEWVSTSITIQESDGVFTQIKEIRVANNKVYILDSGRTLHIFEKEKYLV